MGLNNELEELVKLCASGAGFGDPQAVEQHEREIRHLQFKIAQRNQFRTALIAAVIGATTAMATALLLKVLF